MKKKLALILVACFCIGALTACGGSTQKKVSNNASSASSQTSNGYAFKTADGTAIVIDAEFEQFKSALGQEDSCFEAASCAFGDLDKIWTYKGFEVDTYQQDKVDYVSKVILKDDTVSTPEKVSVGASSADVKAAYGDPSSSDSSQMVYEKDQMKLIFLLKDDAVTQIQYTTVKF